jgi:hypothetical protein
LLELISPKGKQWHDNKTAFRPRANQTSWDKRTAERKALAAMKAKEKELKDEKEAVRQVGTPGSSTGQLSNRAVATCRYHPNEARRQGRTRTLPEDGGEDA